MDPHAPPSGWQLFVDPLELLELLVDSHAPPSGSRQLLVDPLELLELELLELELELLLEPLELELLLELLELIVDPLELLDLELELLLELPPAVVLEPQATKVAAKTRRAALTGIDESMHDLAVMLEREE